MFNFIFKSATYYILWQKFSKQIILISLSVVLICLILGIYDDLYKVLKVSNKDSLLGLLLTKWLIITLIIGFNIYRLKQIKVEDKNEVIDAIKHDEEKIYPKKTTDVLRKKDLLSTTDVILKKYTKQ